MSGLRTAWPEQDQPVGLDELVEPLLVAFDSAATWRLRPGRAGKPVPWTGLPLAELRSPIAEAGLTADPDCDLLCQVLCLAVLLGVEQGRRIERTRARPAQRRLLLRLARLTAAVQEATA